MARRRSVVGWLLAAMLLVVNVSAVGASVPQAVGEIPVAVGAGGGIRPDGTIPNGGTRGLSRSTIQTPNFTGTATNVSAIPSNNPNETAALYRPGGTYAVFWEETKAVTNSAPRYNFGPGFRTTGFTGQPIFTFNGNLVRLQRSDVSGRAGVVNFLYVPGSTQAGNVRNVGSVIPGVTFPVDSGGRTVTTTVTILSREAINGVLPQGNYVVRDAQTRQYNQARVEGNIVIAANSFLAVTYDGNFQAYDGNGIAIYQTELVKPPTFNPPNGTTTGELTGADVVSAYTTTGRISVYAPDFATFGTNSLAPSGQAFSTLPLPSRP